MDKLIICETDRGRYAVRPMRWAGFWNEKGQIKESLNHLALFIKKEDAEKFVEWKNAEEQNRLLKLPCEIKKGNTFYAIIKSKIIHLKIDDCKINPYCGGIDICCINTDNKCDYRWIHLPNKNIFPTKEVAEAILKELERSKEE